MNCAADPPPVLSMARVLAYAIVDESVSFSGRQHLFVDGKLLGPVPKVALCQPLGNPPANNVLILYCNDAWDVLGVASTETIDAAKAEAERCYSGISRRWIAKQVTEDEAIDWVRSYHHDAICSFCGRLPFEVETSISHGSVVICNLCIDEFYGAIHNDKQ